MPKFRSKQTAGNKKIDIPGTLLISGSLKVLLYLPFSQISLAGFMYS